jgi:hypothetical protein
MKFTQKHKDAMLSAEEMNSSRYGMIRADGGYTL